MIDNLTPSWITYSGDICVSPSQFRSLVILRMFWWQHDWWHHLSQTQLDSWNSCVCSTEMVHEPSMIFTSGLNYTTVVACNLSKSGALSLESGRCWSTNLSGRGMSILAKTFEPLMLQWDLAKPHNYGFPSSESSPYSTPFTVLKSTVEPSIFPILIVSSILLAILTTSCQSSNVVAVVWELLEPSTS